MAHRSRDRANRQAGRQRAKKLQTTKEGGAQSARERGDRRGSQTEKVGGREREPRKHRLGEREGEGERERESPTETRRDTCKSEPQREGGRE